MNTGKSMEDEVVRMVVSRTGIPERGVRAVIGLLEEGATVPFISRYRKERTGALDEVAVRSIETTLKTVRDFIDRRDFIADAIESAGVMTQQIRQRLMDAGSLVDLEDIYAPFKPKKRTRATMAKERGLEPLARIIMAGNTENPLLSASRFAKHREVSTAENALAGASDIIAEWVSESTRLRNITRNTYRRTGCLKATVVKGKEKELSESPYAVYGAFSQPVRRISSHQYLALRRAEREGLVRVKYELDEPEALDEGLVRAFVPSRATRACRLVIEDAVKDASKRLLRPSVENEISASLKEEADRVAIEIFSQNLKQLLMAAPLKGKSVLAMDPGYRTGCKIVALDRQGNLLEDAVIYPVPPRSDIEGSARTVSRMVRKYGLQVVAVGNGTASSETEKFVKSTGLFPGENVFVVSENGASVYSASDIARKEFPDKDVTVRGAVSIGRRLIDPLAELVKIDPKSIGVGQYQHDVDQPSLKDALDYTVMSCVNSVGVDVNTASERLLSYISGIGPALAANIVSYRAENGDFSCRQDLKKVPRLGDKAFELAAGFLRVPGGKEPLDNTGIHPESYQIVKLMAKRLGTDVSELPANNQLLDKIDIPRLSASGVGGEETIRDIVTELRKPGRDPRQEDDNEAFVAGVESFDQLSIGQVLPGLVNNITAFGAFVNLGIKENGLIHISKMSKRRISAVSEVLKLGQKVRVRVIDIDTTRHRISLELLTD